MKTKNIIWGLILVLIGVLFILKNLGVIYFSWYGVWKLWPVVLVLIGVAILPVKDSIKVILTVIVLAIAAYFLLAVTGQKHFSDRWSFKSHDDEQSYGDKPMDIDQRIFEAYDTTITDAQLIFDAAAGNFKIDETSDDLFEFIRDGNLGRYNYAIKDMGSRREINIELEEGRVIGGDFKNRVSLKLNPNPVWDINIDVGAASIDLDLTAFKINELDIDGGASSINLSLGELHSQSRVKINSGASSITIRVPESFACEVNTSTVLSSKDLPGFNKIGGGSYVTPDFSEKENNIIIDVEAAVSSLIILRY